MIPMLIRAMTLLSMIFQMGTCIVVRHLNICQPCCGNLKTDRIVEALLTQPTSFHMVTKVTVELSATYHQPWRIGMQLARTS
eukprot:2145451-Prorocentrum_lima.AAC.1